jgi:hypothetical protein
VALLTSTAISIGERWDRGLNWVEILADLIVTFGGFLLGRMTFNRPRRIVREREFATREALAAERAAIARELANGSGPGQVPTAERSDPQRRGEQTESHEPDRGGPVGIGRRHRRDVQQR